ncbi:hypothetical protein P4594_23280 [Priestia megaterium]|uniref:hypothetical protein n=1 Tax=Priestia megaterium TaxID=1404 RepID=UPI002E1ACB4F|nr:hypothetical protein [Priestia megaterium]
MDGLKEIKKTQFEQWDFYKYENLLKSQKKFKSFIKEMIETEDIYTIINVIKSAGLGTNIFQNSKFTKLFDEIILEIEKKFSNQADSVLSNLISDKQVFESLFSNLEELKRHFFDDIIQMNPDYEVATYIVALEIFLSQCFDKGKELHNSKDLITKRYPYELNIRSNDPSLPKHVLYEMAYDNALESSGMILKYFIFKKKPFKGAKRNVPPLKAKATTSHLEFSHIWTILNNMLELWKYSNVSIDYLSSNEEDKIMMKPLDRWLEMNNLISNERFINLRNGWMIDTMSSFFTKNTKDSLSDYLESKKLTYEREKLSESFAKLYFGSMDLSEEIYKITLKKWIKAYNLLIHEANYFLQRRNKKKLNNLNLDKTCICRTENEWIRFFNRHDFNKAEAKVIIETFTFNKKSEDLVDCPFIKVDNFLVMLPSVTAHSDTARALASNFLNRNVNLSFKGKGFEDRVKVGLQLAGINAQTLYRKTEDTEYECDIAFVLDDELFLVECKSHVQPYTTRQHCHLLNKFKDNANQLNRIASFFSNNMNIVIEKLELQESFVPNKINKVVLTSSMIGQPLFINECHVIDESSFTMFIDRNPPSVKQLEKEKTSIIYSTKFDIYKGAITASKLRSLLEMPPQIEIMQMHFGERTLTVPFLNLEITNLQLTTHAFQIGKHLGELKEPPLNEHFNIPKDLLLNGLNLSELL